MNIEEIDLLIEKLENDEYMVIDVIWALQDFKRLKSILTTSGGISFSTGELKSIGMLPAMLRAAHDYNDYQWCLANAVGDEGSEMFHEQRLTQLDEELTRIKNELENA